MRTPRTIHDSGSEGAGVSTGMDEGEIRQTPDGSPHDGAPAGDFFGADLPVVSVPGGAPATFDGYTASPEQDKLPAPGSSEGNGIAPSGVRR